jgi:hypothetical protein
MTQFLQTSALGAVLSIFSLSIAHASTHTLFHLPDIQGVWWSDCDAESANFGIEGNQYYGIFESADDMSVTLENNILTFTQGFPESCIGEKPSGYPVTAKVVNVSQSVLEVRYMDGGGDEDKESHFYYQCNESSH